MNIHPRPPNIALVTALKGFGRNETLSEVCKQPSFRLSLNTIFFTLQVIWKTSTKLGIGYARTADRTGVYVVARYYDHGNVRGQYEENVPKADYLFNTFQDNCNGMSERKAS